MECAQSVIAYLIQNCNVPVRHIVALGGMGESRASSLERDQVWTDRERVEVKVLLNKAVAGT